MKKVLALLLVSVFAVAMIGCGDDDGGGAADNVGACEDWLAAMDCGTTDFSSLVDCNAYANTTCDISDYFQCLTDGTTCDEATGVVDMTGWADCADLASCG
jgi:hypothetical protein